MIINLYIEACWSPTPSCFAYISVFPPSLPNTGILVWQRHWMTPKLCSLKAHGKENTGTFYFGYYWIVYQLFAVAWCSTEKVSKEHSTCDLLLNCNDSELLHTHVSHAALYEITKCVFSPTDFECHQSIYCLWNVTHSFCIPSSLFLYCLPSPYWMFHWEESWKYDMIW